MITVKERYYVLKKQTDKYFEGCQDPIHDYVAELEQELEDEKENHTHFKKCWLEEFKLRHELEQELARLKESQTQKSIIKLCERVDKAEQQVEEFKKAIDFYYKIHIGRVQKVCPTK